MALFKKLFSLKKISFRRPSAAVALKSICQSIRQLRWRYRQYPTVLVFLSTADHARSIQGCEEVVIWRRIGRVKCASLFSNEAVYTLLVGHDPRFMRSLIRACTRGFLRSPCKAVLYLAESALPNATDSLRVLPRRVKMLLGNADIFAGEACHAFLEAFSLPAQQRIFLAPDELKQAVSQCQQHRLRALLNARVSTAARLAYRFPTNVKHEMDGLVNTYQAFPEGATVVCGNGVLSLKEIIPATLKRLVIKPAIVTVASLVLLTCLFLWSGVLSRAEDAVVQIDNVSPKASINATSMLSYAFHQSFVEKTRGLWVGAGALLPWFARYRSDLGKELTPVLLKQSYDGLYAAMKRGDQLSIVHWLQAVLMFDDMRWRDSRAVKNTFLGFGLPWQQYALDTWSVLPLRYEVDHEMVARARQEIKNLPDAKIAVMLSLLNHAASHCLSAHLLARYHLHADSSCLPTNLSVFHPVEALRRAHWLAGREQHVTMMDVEAVREQYPTLIQQYWHDRFTHWTIQSFETIWSARQWLRTLADEQKPFLRFAVELSFLKPVRQFLSDSSFDTKGYHQALSALQKNLQQVTDAPDASKAAYQMLLGWQKGKKGEFEALQSIAKELPMPIGGWFQSGLSHIEQCLVSLANEYLDGQWKAFFQGQLPEDWMQQYPVNPDAKKELTLTQFTLLYGNKGLLAKFAKQYPLIPGSHVGGFLQQASQFRQRFFKDGQPHARVAFKPIELPKEISAIKVSYDGHQIEYVHGPKQTRYHEWPPKTDTPVQLTVIHANGEVTRQDFKGPWGVWRVIKSAVTTL